MLLGMTTKDGGNVIFAGAKNYPCHHIIPFLLNIYAPWHPCHHIIPFLLNIKPGTRPDFIHTL
jgi:hypothetical protein